VDLALLDVVAGAGRGLRQDLAREQDALPADAARSTL